jgi:hypothetical protein
MPKWTEILDYTVFTRYLSKYYSLLGINSASSVIIGFISVTNLMHKSFYSYNITALYMFRAILCSSSGGHTVYM